MVVRGIRRDGNDGLEAFHSGGRRGERDGAVVRRADHADLAGRPGGLDLLISIGGGESLRAPAEPVDDRLGSQDFRLEGKRESAL